MFHNLIPTDPFFLRNYANKSSIALSSTLFQHSPLITSLNAKPCKRAHSHAVPRFYLFENVTLKDSNYQRFVRLVRVNPVLGYHVLHCNINSSVYDPGRRRYRTTPCSATSLSLLCVKWFPNLKAISLYLPLDVSFIGREHSDLPKLLKLLPWLEHIRLPMEG